MTFPKARLVVSAVLFLAWLSFLGYLVFRSSKIIISRPQFLVAQLYVVADVHEDEATETLRSEVTIDEVLWPSRPADKGLVGQKITLPGLPACGKTQGSQGTGKYLLPLQRTMGGEFQIAPVPHTLNFATTPATHGTVESFGVFSHRIQRRLPLAEAQTQLKRLSAAGHAASLTLEEIRIYPWNDGTRAQVEDLIRAK